MLVQRRLEIDNFKPEPYWNIEARTKDFSATWHEPPQYKNTTIKQQDKAKAIASKCQGEKAKVIKIIQKKGNSAPPLLFDLTTLQREANSKFNMSAKQTLGVVQKLYEKHKIVTYPRTDSRYISQDIFKELNKHIASIQGLYSDLTNEMRENIGKGGKFKAVNDKKVSDHHAIIPTTKKPDLNALSDTEKKIYDLICRRFIAAFLPPATFFSTSLELDIAGECFRATGKVFQSLGWLKAEPWRASSDNPLPQLAEGQMIDIDEIKNIKKMTRPPAEYNDSSILRAMETAGKNIENEEMAEAMKDRGLGTPATRAAILERLIAVGYAQRKGKSIVATDKGIQAIKIVTSLSQGLCSPEMTGEWEYKLKKMEQGECSYGAFMKEIKDFVRKEIDKIINAKIEYQKQKAKVIGKCPACGADVIEGKKGYGCSEWKEGCKFVIWKTLAGKKLTENIVKSLLKDKKTRTINGFKSKQGKPFSAALELKQKDDKWKVEFVFEQQSEKPALGKCPLCGGDVVEGPKSYGCSKWKEGCKFAIWKTIGGTKISASIAKALLDKGVTKNKMKFKNKTGKEFTARLKLHKGSVQYDFD
jgi:DNA topoisomerase-3